MNITKPKRNRAGEHSSSKHCTAEVADWHAQMTATSST